MKRWILLMTTVSILGTSQIADAEEGDVDAARALFERGVELFADEDYEGALDAFRRSYEANEVASVLYNIAMCEMALFRYVQSIASFREYLRIGGARVSDERMAEIEGHIAEMESRLGTIRLSVTPADATVTVDGVPVAAERWSRLRIRSGRHVLRVTARAHDEEVRELELSSDEVLELTLVLEPVAIAVGPGPQPPPEPHRSIARRWWFWTIIGVVVAGGAATGLAVGLTRDDGVGSGDWDVRLP